MGFFLNAALLNKEVFDGSSILKGNMATSDSSSIMVASGDLNSVGHLGVGCTQYSNSIVKVLMAGLKN
ncbi:hypothetical protein G9A89_013073 [Geosiphon pyriformis]|nr:hypothetical protein G9A89_013073 [Geosiphon pyriformis]